MRSLPAKGLTGRSRHSWTRCCGACAARLAGTCRSATGDGGAGRGRTERGEGTEPGGSLWARCRRSPIVPRRQVPEEGPHAPVAGPGCRPGPVERSWLGLLGSSAGRLEQQQQEQQQEQPPGERSSFMCDACPGCWVWEGCCRRRGNRMRFLGFDVPPIALAV